MRKINVKTNNFQALTSTEKKQDISSLFKKQIFERHNQPWDRRERVDVDCIE